MPGRPTASVILVNYNGLRYLDPCLEALRGQDVEGGFDVTLIDNASTDGSVEHLRRHHRWVRLVTSSRNLGFAPATDLALRSVAGEHLVLLNNDTVVRPGWLAALVEAAERDPQAGAVTSKLVFGDRPGVIQNAGGLLLSDGSGGDRGTGEPDRGQFDVAEDVFGACGAAMLLRREALADAGAFDESFFMYYEDTDLSWRLRLLGWRVAYEPRAVVEHSHSGTSEEWSDFFLFHVDRNRLFTIVKNAPAGLVCSSFGSLGLRAGRNALRVQGSSRAQNRPPVSEKDARRAALHRRVLQSFGAHLPEMLAKRRQVRGRKRVADHEVLRWMVPREEWDARFASA
jgi:GT2 family glycosyltransferase